MRRWLGAEQAPNAGARHGGKRREPRISKECRPIGGRSPVPASALPNRCSSGGSVGSIDREPEATPAAEDIGGPGHQRGVRVRLIVVGARGATRDLLRRLGERWEATVVDPDVFFIPVFFINVGIEFPLSELADREVLSQALALIGVAFAIKIVPSLLLMLKRFSLRDSMAAGVLLAGQLSVIIALADLGLDLGLLSSGLRAGAIMLVAVSAVVSPIGFRFLAPPLQSRPNDVGGRRLLGRS